MSRLARSVLLPVFSLALAACPGLGGPSAGTTGGGVCGSHGAHCAANGDCCTGFLCQAGACTFYGGGNNGGNSGGISNGGSSGGSTTGSIAGGTSGGHTGGSTGFGGTTGGTGSCGSGAEYTACTSNASCLCGYVCAADPNTAPGEFCVQSCTVSSQCTDNATACVNGRCLLNYCERTFAGGSAQGSYDLPCNAAGVQDGTCLELVPQGSSSPLYGLCLQGGFAQLGATCTQTARTPSSELCQPGDLCLQNASGSGQCYQACDPTGANSTQPCSTGLTCQGFEANAPQAGACLPAPATSGGTTGGGTTSGGTTGGSCSGSGSLPNGSACTGGAATCCSGTCGSTGLCCSSSSQLIGEACTTSTACCVGQCGTSGLGPTCCYPTGTGCSVSTTCCSGSCGASIAGQCD
ncbi:MAG: hypothetical protein ACYCWW_18895 [Deltaproteobacteria bacterium]